MSNQTSSDFTIILSSFTFPKDLDNKRANFRFVVDLRYTNEKGAFAVATAVMPGLDTWWECATNKSDKPNFVRKGDSSEFDINKIDEWDKVALRVKAQVLYQIQVKVIDVDRPNLWDKLSDAFGRVISSLFGTAKGKVGGIPTVGGAIGSVLEDVQSRVAKMLAGGDKVLFKRGMNIEYLDTDNNIIKIFGDGSTDNKKSANKKYTIGFEVEIK
ncbi:hypothetical protein [Candidatus Spongiihabitans sp.]|uniref:hypothetical protein n=1 Tax=Candidatus Spongiihabitans sp. TaxID=3101308 RepID=UPI003C6F3921